MSFHLSLYIFIVMEKVILAKPVIGWSFTDVEKKLTLLSSLIGFILNFFKIKLITVFNSINANLMPIHWRGPTPNGVQLCICLAVLSAPNLKKTLENCLRIALRFCLKDKYG